MSTDFDTLLSRPVARLAAHWERAQGDWRDGLASQFESEHWVPIAGGNDGALRVLKALADEIQAIELVLDSLP